jgi:hypothetical protein
MQRIAFFWASSLRVALGRGDLTHRNMAAGQFREGGAPRLAGSSGSNPSAGQPVRTTVALTAGGAMASSDPQPSAERELAWLLHSGVAWTITGALMAAAHRPLGDAVGVVLMALGLGLIGWLVQRRRHQPPRQLANWILPHRSARSGSGVPRRREAGRHERIPARPRLRAAHPKGPTGLPGPGRLLAEASLRSRAEAKPGAGMRSQVETRPPVLAALRCISERRLVHRLLEAEERLVKREPRADPM